MKRQPLMRALEAYSKTWVTGAGGLLQHASYRAEEEQIILKKFQEFIDTAPHCFERENYPGHITGSAIITNPRLDRVLLTLHGKLNIWLQLGGHADGMQYVDEVALKEAEEESGLKNFSFLKYEDRLPQELAGDYLKANRPLPFDFDCHFIPARKDTPEHFHYDVRFVLVTDDQVPLLISDESHDLRWFDLADARKVTAERSMHRQFDKLTLLRELMLR